MAWDHLDINRPHLVYIILGGFTSLFMLCSSIIKERLYIGEATVATICGIIFGPHAANLIDPGTWGNTDQITLEFSRIVLVVQCFAVGVELPKYYMERHWKSVVLLLVPVMTFGWLVTSLFIWAMFFRELSWLDSLCCAACVTATDPVLASSVVGKGKFAKRVPKHLRDLLSAESGCNDGMAFPFIYLAIYLLRYRPDSNEVSYYWFLYIILYECIFGAFYGVMVGYIARRAIRYAHERDLIDRESFLVFYFVLALFCAGSGSLLGMDDLLVGFACGVGFSNDGWFTEKTEETHVSNVIDLLINLAFFVYLGTIIPWDQYNSASIGTTPWKLVVIAILVIFLRRIPIMLALKPFIPDVKTWREALFAGHFGPIGVGAIFVAIMARAELETESTNPLVVLPGPGFPHLNVIQLIWPITSFLVITSIIVHGSSIAVFTLGKHINTLTITMSYTRGNEEGPNWMERLPRIQSRSKSQLSRARSTDGESGVDEKMPDRPPSTLDPERLPHNFLRRQRNAPMKRKSRWDYPGGPISQSAIAPQPRSRDRADVPSPARSESETLAVRTDDSRGSSSPGSRVPGSKQAQSPGEEIYREGDQTVIEDEEGNVLEVMESKGESERERRESAQAEAIRLMKERVEGGTAQSENSMGPDGAKKAGNEVEDAVEHPRNHWGEMKKRMGGWALKKRDEDGIPTRDSQPERPKRGPALAYQFGNTIIVEDEDGEVVKKYHIPAPKKGNTEKKTNYADPERTRQRLHRMGSWWGVSQQEHAAQAGPSGAAKSQDDNKRMADERRKRDDERVRFSVTAGGRRMSKMEFIEQMQKLDPKARVKLVEQSNVPEAVKEEAREDAREHDDNIRRESQQKQGVWPPEAQAGTQGASLEKIASNDSRAAGPEGLALIDSRGESVPFHSVSRDISRVRTRETAAQRRRRQASVRSPQRTESEGSSDDSEDSGVSQSRARPQRSSDAQHKPPPTVGDDQAETAAERRRREGALGIRTEESSSDEDETKPREQPKHSEDGGDHGKHQSATETAPNRGIRFADDPGRRARLR